MNDNLTKLARRFREMEREQRDRADLYKSAGHDDCYDDISVVADAYARCATELERTLQGETPPEPGMEWPENK